MKQTIIIISSFLFSILFYGKNIGLNLLLFSLISIAILAFGNAKKFKNKTTIVYTLVYLTTAVLVFFQHSLLSIVSNCIAFFTLIGSVTEAGSSIFTKWLNGIYSSIAGLFHRSFEYKVKTETTATKENIDFLHWAKLIIIPLVFIIVFVLLYKNGNAVFSDIIAEINFSFINLQWLLFSVLGYYLFSNIVNPVQVENATKYDLNTGNSLYRTDDFSEEKLKKEKQLGTTLMLFLNLLIVFFLITDVISLNTSEVSTAATLSSQVHNGINALIASIIMAIAIIIYFFRGNLNFFKGNKALKNLSYIWIALNAFLVILIALKNNNYISAFGYTYKRLGVYLYLLITFIGLLTTFIKVLQIKNLYFLFRVNTQIAFAILIAISTVNYDATITNYNINNAESLDINYLINLSNNNAETLYKHYNSSSINSIYQTEIIKKHSNYIQELSSRSWQEYTIENFINNSETQNKNN